jgi:hypothetical protein
MYGRHSWPGWWGKMKGARGLQNGHEGLNRRRMPVSIPKTCLLLRTYPIEGLQHSLHFTPPRTTPQMLDRRIAEVQNFNPVIERP